MAQVVDQFFSRFDALAAKMQAAAPVAWNKLIVLEQYKSWGELIIAIFIFVTTVALFVTGKVLFNKNDASRSEVFKAVTEYNKSFESKYDKRTVPDESNGPYMTFGIMCWAAGSLLFLFNMGFMLTSKWMWIGLMSPESRLINDLWSTLVR